MRKILAIVGLLCSFAVLSFQPQIDLPHFKSAHAQVSLMGAGGFSSVASGGGGTVAFDQKSAVDISAGVVTSVVNAGSPGTSGLSINWTHTPVGTPTAVAVICANYENLPATISSASYGGSSMTIAGTKISAGSGAANRAVYIYGLANPPSGAQTVQVTFSATGQYGNCGAITVTGSDTSTVFRASTYATNTGTSTTASVTVSNNLTGDLIIDMPTTATWSPTFTVGGSQTQRWQDNLNQSSTATPGASSTLPATASSMSWTLSGSDAWAIASVAFKHS